VNEVSMEKVEMASEREPRILRIQHREGNGWSSTGHKGPRVRSEKEEARRAASVQGNHHRAVERMHHDLRENVRAKKDGQVSERRRRAKGD